jgi:hypothetical protein
MKKDTRKLTLSRETLAQLNGLELGAAVGGSGGWSDQSVCPSAEVSKCRSCY